MDGLDAAIAHVNEHGSHHTDSIITEDARAAERFMEGVDSGIVLHNASTQFADGGEFGMGAEIGISTGKLHARGRWGSSSSPPTSTRSTATGRFAPDRARAHAPAAVAARAGRRSARAASGRRIGLLGGSFNPAHEGHRHISLLALKRLGLHEIWWLVSPQNPLKPRAGMAAFDERLAAARAAAGDRRLRVSDIERRLGCRYSVDTVARLKRRFPRHRLVWIVAPTTCPRSRRGVAGLRSSGRYPLR